MNHAETQDVERDLHAYKQALRNIQVEIIELIARIDMDIYQRRRATSDD